MSAGGETAPFINLLLAEDDVAFVDSTSYKVMCKVCKKYIQMSSPPNGQNMDMRRTWKVDWSMHRQNHALSSGVDSPRLK